jgi:hypothetical protein
MIELTHIDDLNLISAQLHRIDLDVEQRCAELEQLLACGGAAQPVIARIERSLERFVTHGWPRPQDPIVRELYAVAAAMVERLRVMR